MRKKNIILLLIFMNSILSFLACTAYERADITVVITHPDPSANGKEVIVEIDSNASKSSVFGRGVLSDNSVTIEMTVTGDNFEGDNALTRIIAYLVDIPEDEAIDIDVYRSIPSAFIKETQFNERYGNVKSMICKIFILQSGGGQFFNVEFPESLNIELDHENYPPIISWYPYPDSVYYELAILVKNKFNSRSEHIGKTNWINAYYNSVSNRITNTSVKVYSDFFRFHEGFGSSSEGSFIIPPTVIPGDIFKIEVIAYSTSLPYLQDGTFMDTITIFYK